MTKRKNVVSKMLLLVLILTLISCCFLGSTFARYTSSDSNKGTLNVAEWNVAYENGFEAVEEAEISPSMKEYTDDTYVAGNARKHTSERKLIATIKNTGDVDALVELSAVVDVVNKIEGADTAYDDEAVKGLFTVKLYTSTNNAPDGATAYTEKVNVAAESGVLYIFADITWTSDDESVYGEAADKRDTWVGKNVTSIGFTVSYTAVQNTQIPEAQA